MKIKLNLLLTFLFISLNIIKSSGQTNLVPNPDFENGTCPAILGDFTCNDWVSATNASPDYFQAGCTSDCDVPSNCFSTNVPAHSSNAYAGIITYATSTYTGNGCNPSNYIFREYIEAKLTCPLLAGHDYPVSLWVHHSELYHSCQLAENNYRTQIGVAFSPTLVNVTFTGCNRPNITFPAAYQYMTPNIIYANTWEQISFTYTAVGGERYIIIGNFLDNTCAVDTPAYNADMRGYYYIDDVEVMSSYPCDCDKCQCEVDAALDHFSVDNDGISSVVLNIGGSPIQPVDKFRITLVNYQPNVPDDCRKCEVDKEEMFGTITGAPTLFGEDPIYGPYDSYNIVGRSREVTWCFTNPVQWSFIPITLDLKFPPVYNLDCCKNDDEFCFRIEFWGKECKACDRLICRDASNHPPKIASPVINTPGVKNPDEKVSKMKIIPNPASDSFEIIIPPDQLNGVLEIYTLDGSLIKSLEVSSGMNTVNTKSFAEGTYLVRYKNSKASFEEKVEIRK